MAPLNIFVTEGNAEIYLSKLRATFSSGMRDELLRLLSNEQSQMTSTLTHLQNGGRRVAEGLSRIQRQREELARLADQGGPTDAATFLLETLEKTQLLLEIHCERLRSDLERHRL